MNCPWCNDWLQQRGDGAMPAYPPPEMTLHWDSSPSCRQRCALAERSWEVLPAATAVRPPEHFADQVLARVGRERWQARLTAWATTLAAVLLTGLALMWTMLGVEPARPSALATTRPTPTNTTPSRVPPERLTRLRNVVEPLEGATDRTLSLTREVANRAEAKFRKILPDFELAPAEDAWTASVLPVRVVGDAASAGFDPLATSTREAYQTVKQYLPPLPKQKPSGRLQP